MDAARILIVEDSAFMRLFLRRLLRRYQFVFHLRQKGRSHTTLRPNRFART